MADLLSGKKVRGEGKYPVLCIKSSNNVCEIITELRYDLYLSGRKLRRDYRCDPELQGSWEWSFIKRKGFIEASFEHLLQLANDFPDEQKENQIKASISSLHAYKNNPNFHNKEIVLLADRV